MGNCNPLETSRCKLRNLLEGAARVTVDSPLCGKLLLQALLSNWKGLRGRPWTRESRKICINKNEEAVKLRFFYQWGYGSLEMIYWWLKNTPAALITGRQAGRQAGRKPGGEEFLLLRFR